MKNKKFDCVEMKHQAQKKLWQKLSKMTKNQQLEYWAKASESFVQEINEAHNKRKSEYIHALHIGT